MSIYHIYNSLLHISNNMCDFVFYAGLTSTPRRKLFRVFATTIIYVESMQATVVLLKHFTTL